MAQRCEIGEVVLRNGRPVANASVQVNLRDSTAATVFAAQTGGTTLTNPLTTTSTGRIEGWLDEGSYDLVVTHGASTPYTQRFEAVSGSASTGRLASVESDGGPVKLTKASQVIDSEASTGTTLTLKRNEGTNTNLLVLQNMQTGGRCTLTFRDEDGIDQLRVAAHNDLDPGSSTPGGRFYTRRLTPRGDGVLYENHLTIGGESDFPDTQFTGARVRIETHDTDGALWTDKSALLLRRSEADAANEATEFLRARTSAVGSNYFYRNLDAADTAGPVVRILQDHATDDQLALRVQQDGTAAVMELVRGAAGAGLVISGGGYIQMSEQAEPVNSSADSGRLFMKDNGAGKTQFCVKFNTGAVVVIATEP